MNFYVVQFLSGLAAAATLFLVAAGLSLIFGVTRIVNFAHGSFYMLGAYVAYSLTERLATGVFGFWASVVLAAAVVGLIGVAMEVLLLRRLYRSPELFQLLATFGVVLIVQDAVLAAWGAEDLLGRRAPGLRGAVSILGQPFPEYELVLILLGPAVLGLLWLLLHRTRWGVLVRAATQDREMASALGINERLLFTSVLFVGSALAGLGGALQVPREAVNLHMDIAIIVEAFVVVVVGGMGSIGGAFLAALLIGQLHAFGILIFPGITLVLVFLVMAVVLVIRPHGLMGRPESPTQAAGRHASPPVEPASPVLRRLGVMTLGALLLLPFVGGDYAVLLATETIILALFAASLHFMMGPGGMMSFGHAAFFGLGAYGAGMATTHFSLPMSLALVLAPVAAGLGGLAVGWFVVRRSGVYLAMLTLAFAQIVWAISFQWVEVTGGDNGLLGLWPPGWARDPATFY
ncbi:MAG TPA: ABC transporter permease, partial [Azospirillaceae bacterium]|nr:ABC transporter permease [Azospirillaceae bacterium]